MQTIDRILVALELDPMTQALTPGSRRAADVGLALAPKIGAETILFHSTADDEHWDSDSGDYFVVPGGFAPEHRPALDAVLAEYRDAGLTVSLETPAEKAWVAITKRVMRDSIGLVICGKRNHPDAPGQRIGSVATKLVRKCPCAVWVAKASSGPMPRRIVASSDGGPVGAQVVAYAGFLAQQLAAQLHIVHAIQLPMSVQMRPDPDDERAFEHRRCKEMLDVFESQLKEAGYTGDAFFEMGITAPTTAITRVVDGVHPDLVVMGTIARGGIAGVLVGNTAERLLQRLDCSLLTVKPADFVCPVQPDERD